METVSLIFISFAGFFLIFIGLVVSWKILSGEINITTLISEGINEKASLSRFQMFVWTFVIGFSFLYVLILNNEIPEIPDNVLTLLGISGGTYVISKGIQKLK